MWAVEEVVRASAPRRPPHLHSSSASNSEHQPGCWNIRTASVTITTGRRVHLGRHPPISRVCRPGVTVTGPGVLQGAPGFLYNGGSPLCRISPPRLARHDNRCLGFPKPFRTTNLVILHLGNIIPIRSHSIFEPRFDIILSTRQHSFTLYDQYTSRFFC